MFTTLLKKQFLEINSSVFANGKNGKPRSKGQALFLGSLLILAFFSFGFMIFHFASLMGVLINGETDWIYFSVFSLISIVLGVLGSVFSSYSALYDAKDNELLLSMPIKPIKILFVRVISVYSLSLMFSAIIWVPSVIYYWTVCAINFKTIVFPVVLLFFVAAFVTALSSALGYLVALVASKMNNKNFITVIFTLLFLGIYYYAYFNAINLINRLLSNVDKFAKTFKTYLFPIYHLGLGACGKTISFLIFVLISIALFLACVYVLSISFIKIATSNKGAAKKVYKEKEAKAQSAFAALLKREWKRFISTPIYLMNCGLGLIFLVAADVLLLIKRNDVAGVMGFINAEIPFAKDILPVVIVAVVCMIISTNAITVPSVSLEAKTLWLIRSLPVKTADVLKAKQVLHILFNGIPAIITTLIISFVLGIESEYIIYTSVFTLEYVFFSADFGLYLGIKKPVMNWTNETVPVKQSVAIIIYLFSNWALCFVLGLGAYLLRNTIAVSTYFYILIVLFAIVFRFIDRWISTSGVKEFERL